MDTTVVYIGRGEVKDFTTPPPPPHPHPLWLNIIKDMVNVCHVGTFIPSAFAERSKLCLPSSESLLDPPLNIKPEVKCIIVQVD